jgi:alanyl aminopeptidase
MRVRSPLPSVCALVLLAACSAGSPPDAGAPRPPPSVTHALAASAREPLDPGPPSGLRLPATASPRRYSAELTLVPSASTFQGSIDIELTVHEASSVLWLNATELTIERAELHRGGETQALRVLEGDEHRVGFIAKSPIAPGPARLSLSYRGRISDKDDRGVFSEKEGGADYLFTQFESIDARRAFPCFDEPSAKVPWQLTLEVPAGDVALSNTPVLSEAPSREGMKRVRFAETKPLPSYLVAFAVGPFDLLDAGVAGKRGTPVRLAVPRGRSAEAKTAAAATTALLGILEDYFELPYPYEKLDVVAIPQVVSFGAMENAGLITYYARGLMAKPDEDTAEHQRQFADVMAHELAHQWFGNLVTMRWWDDIWLNEAFASWMEVKALSRFRPGWSWETLRLQDAASAMRHDRLESARKVRQEIASNDDIQNAFDTITYLKGGALLGMFEAWIGPELFRKGIHRYLDQHAHGNASSRDFAAAISAEAGRDVSPVFASFLDQGGLPVVRAELSCAKGEASMRLSQRRFLPVGSSGSSAQTWQIPVCLRWNAGEGRACTLLAEPSATIALPAMKGCQTAIVPNAGSFGYYHVGYRPSDLDALLRHGTKTLTLAERLGMLSDLGALVKSGDLPVGEVLSRLPLFASDESPHVRRAAASLLVGLPLHVVPDALRPSFARYVGATFGKEARALGLVRRSGESEELGTLRAVVVGLVGGLGEDRALVDEARALSLRWLDDPRVIDADAIDTVLPIAAARGDRALFDRFHAELSATKDDTRRAHLLGAMASFRDPSVVRASLALFLSGELDPREAVILLEQDSRMNEVVFGFVRDNFDRIVEKMPADTAMMLPGVVSRFCDEAHRREVLAFFAGKIERISGGPRALSQAVEEIALCSALRSAQEESLRSFLKTR